MKGKYAPTPQLKAVGIWGIGALIALAIVSQVVPAETLDLKASFMGVPLGTAVVYFFQLVGGYWRGKDGV